MAEQEIHELIRNRGSVKQKLTNLEKFINTIKTASPDKQPNLTEVELRYKNYSDLLKSFDVVQSTLEAKCKDQDLDSHYKEREDFEDRFYAAQDFLTQHLQVSQVSSENPFLRQSSANKASFDPLQNVLLPKIKLPTFSGEFSEWITFKNNFSSTISNNANLNESQKFHFLKAALEGYALRLIQGLEDIGDSFQKAWNLLCDRFDKKQFLLDSHFKSILDIQALNRESYVQFRKLLDETTKHLTALDGLKLGKDKLYDSFIIHVISNKLDKSTIRDWKEIKCQNDLPSLEEFTSFLKDKSDLLQCLDNSQNKTNFNSTRNHLQMNLAINTVNRSCNYCKKDHSIYKCPEFLELSVDSRIDKVRALKLCENCLLSGHSKRACRVVGNCKICKTHRHNSLLHKNSDISSSAPRTANTINMLVRPNKRHANIQGSVENSSHVLLSTITCQVQDAQGQFHLCKALLDCGAQSNLVTKRFCEKVKIPLANTNMSIMGINQTVSCLNKKCTINLFSNFTSYSTTISCLVVPSITTNIPSCDIITKNWIIPPHINLADPDFDCPQEVDLLLGASIFWDLLVDGKIVLGKNMPTLQNTKFGWIVTGVAPINTSMSVCNFSKVHIPEDDQLKRFWQLEEMNNDKQIMSADDIICESLFEKDTYRNENGQFVVKLPLKHSPELLGNSKENAIKRFKTLEKKFSDNNFKQLYFDFIQEYKTLGHMSEVSDELQSNKVSYFLPHDGVLKETSITTKLRTVFDGSCKSSSSWSLNDLQYIGPKVQNDIIDILLRFRTYKYVVSADVSKMYRQILMHPEHRPLQQIVWRENPEDEFTIFQLNTVTYGTRSAPYLAIKCIRELAKINQIQFPDASKTILQDFYVDDLLTGSDDLDELKTRCRSIYDILNSASFNLRKWISNNDQIVLEFTNNEISNAVVNIGEQDSYKTLGIQWLSKSDNLKYTVKEFKFKPPVTKRYILSIIAQIYDPLGLLSPVIVTAKILIQKLWSLHIPWDTPVPEEIEKVWFHFQNNLYELNLISIPRNTIAENYKLVDVHCFCDASQSAFATCIYLRSISNFGQYNIRLLCSKTKVAPLKTITIPKLELCACLLGSKLASRVKSALNLSVPIYFWSDSQIALCWINTEPNLLQVFVANRVSQVQSLTDIDNWRYVNTKSNPSDLASKGVMPKNLVNSKLWWTGPDFLQLPISSWPVTDFGISKSDLPELKKNVKIFQVTNSESFNLFSRYSTLVKLKRITAYCLRFINNIKHKVSRQSGPLTREELDKANHTLIKLAQTECFPSELSLLKKNKYLDRKHKLASLCPFLDDNGIIHVGGRLRNTHLPFSTRHPILLSGKHFLTRLIFEHKHKTLLHPGPQLLLSCVRQFYWPLSGRILAKRTVKDCLICFKFHPVPFSCPMSSFPNERITPRLPFEISGLDYAGPFSILNRKGRGSKIFKCYLAIFVCFCTKSVHLEIVTDLTTSSFLSCFRRFISRRGVPSVLYSDNGSTFVGAHNELKSLGQFLLKHQDSIVDSTSEFNIKWNFIPPYTPNHGGLWEAAVKSAKHFIKRILINCNVTYEEFNTLVIQVEGILNSRPLFSMSNDPNDLSPITPSHFLIGRVLTTIPDKDLSLIPDNRLTRLQHVQKLYQQFWVQFSKHYISQLHQQYKWKAAPCKVSPGTLVLIKHDNQPPCKWPLGRILKLFPGKDEVFRVAEVKTSKGITTRSVRHLCPLPLQDDTNQ